MTTLNIPTKKTEKDNLARANLAVEARDITIVRGGTNILNGVSCKIKRGQVTAILGHNGCGKTTFSRAITGKMFPTSGQLNVLGEQIGRTDIRALRKRIGIVNPTTDGAGVHSAGSTVDADLPVIDAVLTGFFATVGLYDKPTDQQRARANVLIKQVGLSHRKNHRLAVLSTGEQRRALIARSLVNMPELLILDEPTSGLDIAGREQILVSLEMILDEKNPPAVLMITHHVEELSPRTSQVILMKNGNFITSGQPDDVITPELLSEAFGCKVYVRKVHERWWLEVLPEAWLDLV